MGLQEGIKQLFAVLESESILITLDSNTTGVGDIPGKCLNTWDERLKGFLVIHRASFPEPCSLQSCDHVG